MSEYQPWQLFWAKTGRKSDELPPERLGKIRPLWAHMIDVACTALLLWERFLPELLKRRIAASLGLSVEDAGRFLAFWVGAHDVGKAIPGFQGTHKPSVQLLRDAGLVMPAEVSLVHHGHASIRLLRLWAESRGDGGGAALLLEGIAAYSGFHHGRLCRAGTWRKLASLQLGDESWRQEQFRLLDEYAGVWGLRWPVLDRRDHLEPWLLPFSAWTTISDWIGSREVCYPLAEPDTDPAAYLILSREGAERAFGMTGIPPRPALKVPGFLEVFGEDRKITEMRPLQKILSDLPLPASGVPALTIVEAPTSEGKTEGSFYLGLRQQWELCAGFYVAMPSRGTSDQLYGRFQQFIARVHDPAAGTATPLLVYANSFLHKDMRKYLKEAAALAGGTERYDNDDGKGEEEAKARQQAASWFLPKRRSLLAPYAVGTVDQAMLGVLYAKFFPLRLLGLAGKTVIFDEVHAYDLYMNVIFCRLLGWLRELGANVILLSATLPDRLRRLYLNAWGVTGELPPERLSSYPLVISAVGTTVEIYDCEASVRRSPRIAWGGENPEEFRDEVERAVRAGATVGIIVNTVGRAQDVFTCLRDHLHKAGLGDVPVLLYHARFPEGRRRHIASRVEDVFHPNRPTGVPAVLVATQVAEQSLDIDLDLLMSELAPIDLLLQRFGRQHRKEGKSRPVGYEDPLFRILCPEPSEGELPCLKNLGGNSVYASIVMWQTWATLRGMERWSLPDDYRPLIEAVYGETEPLPPEWISEKGCAEWLKAIEDNLQEMSAMESKAEARCVSSPEEMDNITAMNRPELADEDDEDVHEQLRAMTRSGGPSVEVICLHDSGNGKLYLDLKCSVEARLVRKPDLDEVIAYREASLRLSHGRVVPQIRKLEEKKWDSVANSDPALRGVRALIFRNGVWKGKGVQIRYDHELGLIIEEQA